MSTMLPSGGTSFYGGSSMYGVETPNQHDDRIESGVSSAQGVSNGSSDANSAYLDMYQKTGKTEYWEKYIDNLIAQQNLSSAQAFEERMSNSQFQRAIQDIKNAGYNPWLAISGAGASYSSPGVANQTTTSASNAINNRKAQYTKTAGSLVSSALMVAAIIMKAII